MEDHSQSNAVSIELRATPHDAPESPVKANALIRTTFESEDPLLVASIMTRKV